MLQIPNLPNYQLPQPNYNAVKIDIHNPSVGGATCPVMPQMPPMQQLPQAPQAPQYAPVTAPYYNYPQTQLYDYPQNVNAQPYYLPAQQPVPVQQAAQAPQQVAPQVIEQQPVQAPVQQPVPMVCPPCPKCGETVAPVPAPQVAQAAAAVAAPVAAPVQQVNINEAPKAKEPVAVEEKAVEAPASKVDVVAPQEQVKPQLDINEFLAKLADPDYEVQANAMEKIANMVKDEPQKATELLEPAVIDSLINILNKDSSKLAGPTQEQIAARNKMMSGQKISDEEKALAVTITPMEQAERNKSYAMFTTAILQKLFAEEVNKMTGSTVPLNELPGAVNIVTQLKENPNPMVRTSAIESLSYIQNPEYKKDLSTLFTIAKNDQDKNVQEAAVAALEKLNQI